MRARNDQVARARASIALMIAVGFVAVALTGSAEALALHAGAPLWAELAIIAVFLVGCLTVGLLVASYAALPKTGSDSTPAPDDGSDL